MTRDLDRLEELAQAAYDLVPYREGTGWHWAGDVSGGYPRLALSAWISGRGRCTVMDFERWGMQSAGPRFPSDRMMMRDARELVTFEVGRRGVVGQKAAEADDSVYRYDVDGIAHPIAEYIAAADPSTVLALVAEIRRLRETVGLLHGWEARAKKFEAHVADLATDAEEHRVRAEAAEAAIARVAALADSIDTAQAAITAQPSIVAGWIRDALRPTAEGPENAE